MGNKEGIPVGKAGTTVGSGNGEERGDEGVAAELRDKVARIEAAHAVSDNIYLNQ